MQVIALLAIVLLMAGLLGKYRSHHARMIIGAVFGSLYFVVWPFVQYIDALLQWSELQRVLALVLLCLAAMVSALILVKRKCAEILGGISLSVFFILTVASWTFEIDVKHVLDRVLYFDNADSGIFGTVQALEPTVGFEHPAGGFAIKVPKEWIEKDDLGELFVYFQKMKNNEVLTELRPMCLRKQETSLGQIIINIREQARLINRSQEITCYDVPGKGDQCSVQYKKNNGELERVSLFGFGIADQEGYFLDFIIDKPDSNLLSQVHAIAASIQPASLEPNASPCVSTDEWF